MDMAEGAPKRGIGKRKRDGGGASLVERVVAETPKPQVKVRGIGRRNKDGAEDSAKPRERSALIEKAALAVPPSAKPPKPVSTDGPSAPPIVPTATHDALQGDGQAASTPAANDAPTAAPPKKGRPPRAWSKVDAEVDLESLKAAGYITPDMPTNLLSEEFRIIKRSLVLKAFAKGDHAIRNGNMILVSSSNPSEGKTFCTINLALSIATEQDVTVLLIDADFSKPDALNRLGINAGKGLMDILDDPSISVGECLVRTNIPNLVLLPAGRPHNLGTELLASDRMREVAEELATRYPDRLIIFDSPPALASSAASVLALHAGQAVFVIEAERTTEAQIKESLNLLSECEHINLLLNKTRFSGSNTKFATYYGYGAK